MPDTLALAALDLDPDIEPDPGCSWHPRMDKTGVRDDAGLLRDLNDAEVTEHQTKPEADEQYDGAAHRARVGRELGAAEDSDTSPAGEV